MTKTVYTWLHENNVQSTVEKRSMCAYMHEVVRVPVMLCVAVGSTLCRECVPAKVNMSFRAHCTCAKDVTSNRSICLSMVCQHKSN